MYLANSSLLRSKGHIEVLRYAPLCSFFTAYPPVLCVSDLMRYINATQTYLCLQVVRENKINIGNISSLPASISQIRISLEKIL